METASIDVWRKRTLLGRTETEEHFTCLVFCFMQVVVIMLHSRPVGKVWACIQTQITPTNQVCRARKIHKTTKHEPFYVANKKVTHESNLLYCSKNIMLTLSWARSWCCQVDVKEKCEQIKLRSFDFTLQSHFTRSILSAKNVFCIVFYTQWCSCKRAEDSFSCR